MSQPASTATACITSKIHARLHFRLQSPEMCGKCHADKELMQKYGISTDVFDTYVADFHGTTVAIFKKNLQTQK